MQQWSDQMPASRSRAVRLDSFGGPEVLNIRQVPAPQAGPGQIRVRVTAAGLNPMDWIMTADADTASPVRPEPAHRVRNRLRRSGGPGR